MFTFTGKSYILYGYRLLSGVLSFRLEGLPLAFLAEHVQWQWISSAFVYLEMFTFSLLFERQFCQLQNAWLTGVFLHHCSIPLPSGLQACCCKCGLRGREGWVSQSSSLQCFEGPWIKHCFQTDFSPPTHLPATLPLRLAEIVEPAPCCLCSRDLPLLW